LRKFQGLNLKEKGSLDSGCLFLWIIQVLNTLFIDEAFE